MSAEHRAELKTVKLDIEVDFGPFGGPQRFRDIGELDAWIKEETEFWSWLRKVNKGQFNRGNILGNHATQFDQYRNYQSAIGSAETSWINQKTKLESLENQPARTDAHLEQIEGYREALKKNESAISSALSAHLRREIVEHRHHLCRLEPKAQFVHQLSQTHSKEEAAYALLEFLEQEVPENKGGTKLEQGGRLLARLFEKDLIKKAKPSSLAFQRATNTWNRELGNFKEKYEQLIEEYEALRAGSQAEKQKLVRRIDALKTVFDKKVAAAEGDLANLTETYETHMQLKGPFLYWRGKRKEHYKAIKQLRGWIIGTVIFGMLALLAMTHWLIPESLPKGTVPWRQLVYIALISTFAFWPVKFLIKLMLSNIHLHSDAREREVMIQTFMSLIRHESSRETITKEQVAMVLAPLFNPSTTGVIKDESGPASLTDFITRMGGK